MGVWVKFCTMQGSDPQKGLSLPQFTNAYSKQPDLIMRQILAVLKGPQYGLDVAVAHAQQLGLGQEPDVKEAAELLAKRSGSSGVAAPSPPEPKEEAASSSSAAGSSDQTPQEEEKKE